MITLDSIVRRKNGCATYEVDDSVVIESGSANTFGLESIGAQIWIILAQSMSVHDLCENLGRQYDVDPSTCERDVLKFLIDLAEEGLVDIAA
jgi:hypothetical protein